MRAENVYLPPNGHFGVSAATGGLADDHDVSLGCIRRPHPHKAYDVLLMFGWVLVLYALFGLHA